MPSAESAMLSTSDGRISIANYPRLAHFTGTQLMTNPCIRYQNHTPTSIHFAFIVAIFVLAETVCQTSFGQPFPPGTWVSNQSDCINAAFPTASFYDPIYWSDFQSPLSNQDIRFDSRIVPRQFRTENHIYFGEFQTNYFPPCSNPHFDPEPVQAGVVDIITGEWIFDLGSNVANGPIHQISTKSILVGLLSNDAGGGVLTIRGEGGVVDLGGNNSIILGFTADTIGALHLEPGTIVRGIGQLGLGYQDNATGTLTLNSATLEARSAGVRSKSAQDPSVINLSNGSELRMSNNLSIDKGIVNVDASHITSPSVYVGVSGVGELRMSGSDATIVALYAGLSSGVGNVSVSNGSALNVSNFCDIAGGALSVAGFSGSDRSTAQCSIMTIGGSGVGGSVDVGFGGQLTVAGNSDPAEAAVYVGEYGYGSLNVTQGGIAEFTDGSLTLGRAPTGNGVVRAHGAGSRITAELTDVGFRGRGSLEIGDDAIFMASEQIKVGDLPGSNGTMNILNSGEVRSSAFQSPTGSSGIIGGDLGATGTVNIDGPGSKWLQDGGVSFGFRGNGTGNITQGGLLESQDGYIARFPGSGGSVDMTGVGSLWDNRTSLNVGGDDAAKGGTGTLTVGDQARVEVGETLRIWDDGVVDISGGGAINVGMVSAPARSETLRIGSDGLLMGTGTIIGNVVVDGGITAPGASPGVLRINGDFSHLSGGLLAMEISGTMPGSEYDQLLVAGNLVLQGVIQISFTDGYLPNVGDTFDLFQATTFDFTSPVTFLNVPSGFQYSTSLNNNQLSFTVNAVPEPSVTFFAMLMICAGLVKTSRCRIATESR